MTQNDPLCDAGWPHRCRHYRLTAPAAGVLKVTMTWSSQVADPYPLDIGVVDPLGRTYYPSVGPGAQRQVSVQVSAGTTYVIEIWSSLSPGEEFELHTAIEPNRAS